MTHLDLFLRQNERDSRQPPAGRRPCVPALVLLLTMVVFGGQGCTKPKAMDVTWSKDLVVDNAFARNPVWYQQT